jgi:ribosome biogenesis GTPase
MNLTNFGYNAKLEQLRTELNLQNFEVGRVISEHKERYVVRTEQGELDAEVTGNLRFSAQSREDFPAVGDWVAVTAYDAEFCIIHRVLPRQSVISRRAAGHSGEIQIIATNIDFAFLVQSIDRDFNINRMERYLTICNASQVEPIAILTKTDLIAPEQLNEIVKSIEQRIKNIRVIAVSNETLDGYETLRATIEPGKTYCMLGSSGVGKSTILNKLSGKEIMQTGAISESVNRGRHVTSHRELIVLESGGILIDNPGMREVGIADSGSGLETTFDAILRIGKSCRYTDCTHTGEAGCAVIASVESGEIDQNSYENYLKMEREKAHFETSLADRRKRDKAFGKIMKNYKKDIKRNKL